MRKTTTILAATAAAVMAALGARGSAEAAPPPATHEVKMYMEGPAARFEPARLTIRAGDRVRFVTVSGAPHNVSFDPAKVPDDAERALAAAMPNQMQPLWGPLLTDPKGEYTIAFTGVKPGTYEFFCMPHMAMGMKGTITVQ
ncbi:MAG TPA: plastocyanin/azurin family copper-binding protein [Longimicrobium sp.]|nr:plastocyanin/azurin family copper-binding protein [Longimicrobium sp.]